MGELPAELLEVVVCPHTHQPLKRVSANRLQELNEAIARGAIHNRRGDRIVTPVDGALVCDEGRHAYLITGGIADLIWDESVVLAT